MSSQALLNSKLKLGQELEEKDLEQYKRLSQDEIIYLAGHLSYTARPKSKWEVETYLKKHGASPSLSQDIVNKLSKLDLVNDIKYAEILTSHYTRHSPTSRRKILSKLKQKRISEEAIEAALASDEVDDLAALREVVKQKQRQSGSRQTKANDLPCSSGF